MSRKARLPAAMQSLLESIYDVPLGHDVRDFLVTDRNLAAALKAGAGQGVREQLLVSEDGEYVDISLFLDEDVLRRLCRRDPRVDLDETNLEDFCLVVEGISHFVYLAWNARHDKSVTLMELELQAEVDKFIAALHLLGTRGVAPALHRCLFDYVSFDPRLDGARLTRYRHASRYAGKYCKTLYRRFMHRVRRPGMLAELRRFYRLPQSAKIRHIDTAFSAAA